MTSLADYTDEDLWSLWRGDDCPSCQAALAEYGILPVDCGSCGADRDALWRELERRDLIGKAWDGHGFDEMEFGGAS